MDGTAPPDAAQALTATDRLHLERARALARKGWGGVNPNPMVGCVVVRDGEVVGEGYHRTFGGPHAEVLALRRAGDAARGATVYVSLEPCAHHGKTPPCTEALLQAGVARVVYGAADPTAEAAGGGARLRAAGLEVVGPVWSRGEAHRENPAFFHCAGTNTPFVALKLALTLDGAIAEAPGTRTRITGAEAHREVHRIRAGFDAVLVGANTARVDDPLLTVRHGGEAREGPRRFLLDTHARLPSDAAVFRDADRVPVHVFTGRSADEMALERLEAAGAHVHPVDTTPEGLDLKEVLRVAWDLGVRSILCEGGGRLASSLLREGRVGRMYLFLAPRTLGSGAVPGFPGDPGDLGWSRFSAWAEPRQLGRDLLWVLDKETE